MRNALYGTAIRLFLTGVAAGLLLALALLAVNAARAGEPACQEFWQAGRERAVSAALQVWQGI